MMSISFVKSLKRLFSAAPEGTAALFFIQIFSTLGFAVLYSTLVLYATKHLHLSVKAATTLMGVFGAFNYGLHPGGPAPRGRLPLELRWNECRFLRRVQRRRLLPGHRELREPLHLRDGRQLRRHRPRRAYVENSRRSQHHAARRDDEAVPAAPGRRHLHSYRNRTRRVVHAPAARQR